MIRIDGTAPLWAQQLVRSAQQEIDDSLSIFVSRTPFAIADLPAAADHTNKIALLSNGTFWLAKSDGTTWYYPDNTSV